MHNAIPPIDEAVGALKERLRQEHDGHKKPRLQLLYLLASGQAHSRHEGAHRLGGHRHTMRRWLALSAAGGLEAVLAPYVPAGTPVSRAPHGLASLEQALPRPEGVASYEALRQWVRRTPGVEVQDKTLYTLVRTRFQAKLQGARPTHTKNPCGHSARPGDLSGPTPAGDPACQGSSHPGVQPRRQPVRLLDDAPRRLTARGVQPSGPLQHVCAWCSVYGAVEPLTGARFLLELPYLNAARLQRCIDACAEAFPASLKLLLLDNRGAHTAERLSLPAHVRLGFWPPYCPALNPSERVWRDRKEAWAWLHFAHLAGQQEYVAERLRTYEQATLHALTGYPDLVEAMHALCA
jgi:putative transposase